MWEMFTWEEDKPKNKPKPYVYINPWQIRFNHAFVKLLGLLPPRYVSIFLNPTTKQVGFLFHDDADVPCKLTLSTQNHTLAFSIRSLLKNNPWIEQVAKYADTKKRKFEPQKMDNLWTITLEQQANI